MAVAAATSLPSGETQVQIIQMFEKSGIIGLILFVDIVAMAALIWALLKMLKLYIDFAGKRDEIEANRTLVVERVASAITSLTQLADREFENLAEQHKATDHQIQRLHDRLDMREPRRVRSSDVTSEAQRRD